MPTPHLSIVVLCYRSNERIIGFAHQIKDIGLQITTSLEIILVGNYVPGTADQTAGIVNDLAIKDPIFRAISKPKQGMMGWDMRSGLETANGEIICVIDGDSQFPAKCISECYKQIQTGKYGMVKTYRANREDGLYRKTISYSYNWFFRLLFPGVQSKDVNSKPKMFKKEVLQQMELKSDDWFIDAEIMLNIEALKIPYTEIPTVFHELNDRASFVKPSAILEFLKNMISYRFKRNR